jgi:hypothetical protein
MDQDKSQYVSRTKKRKASLQQLVTDAKKNPCTDCGVKYHPWQMDLDHVRDKKLFDLGEASKYGSSREVVLR